MIEQQLDITTADRQMPTFIVHPEERGPHPVVLFQMDAPGMRSEIRNMARRLATAGHESDHYAPPEMVEAFEKAVSEAGTRGRVEWYPGTEHGFAFAERPAYDRDASERHWERIHDLFRRRLVDD